MAGQDLQGVALARGTGYAGPLEAKVATQGFTDSLEERRAVRRAMCGSHDRGDTGQAALVGASTGIGLHDAARDCVGAVADHELGGTEAGLVDPCLDGVDDVDGRTGLPVREDLHFLAPAVVADGRRVEESPETPHESVYQLRLGDCYTNLDHQTLPIATCWLPTSWDGWCYSNPVAMGGSSCGMQGLGLPRTLHPGF